MGNAQTLLQMLGMRPEPAELGKAAVVIVDAQREYLDGAVPLKGIDAALVEIKKLLEKARANGVPVFHVVHHTMPGAPIFAPDSWTSEIIDAVKPVGNEAVVKKNLPSAFVNTELKKFLDDTGRKELVVAGFMTHMCINATTRSAVDLGFQPTVVGTACATRDLPGANGGVVTAEELHRSNLASLADLLACVCERVDELR